MRKRLVIAVVLTAVAAAGAPLVVAREAAAAANPPVVRAFGTAPKFKGPAGPLNAPVVAATADPSGGGYWSLTADGGVFASGGAGFFGAPAGSAIAGAAVDMVGSPTGDGYWVASAQGGVYHYGDARWKGSARDKGLVKPIVAIAATPTGKGYWLVTSGGRVFAFGDAEHLGNAATLFVPPKVVDIAPTPTGNGYALLDANGWIYAFGDAKPISTRKAVAQPAVALAITASGKGYWVLGRDGGVARYADAAALGGANDAPVVAIDLVRTKAGTGYWIATGSAFPPVPGASGEGRRIVYSNGQQRIWLIESNGIVSHSFRVSGRTGAPPFGTYSIASKSEMSSSGSLRLPYMSRFYKASSGKWIGFHGIPLRPDGSPIQTDAQLGQPLSHGCVRMNQQDVKVVWDFTPIGTKIVVVP